MKILILTQYYTPENTLISPTPARALQAKGHEIRVLTGYPNYPEGRLFDGYKQRWRSWETVDGVQVMRVPLFADHSQTPIRRIANYSSFAFSSASARSLARWADVVYVYATQMTPALGPWLWRLAGGAPYVLHVQDLWPDSITGSSLVGTGVTSRVIERALKPWLTSVYSRAGGVIGIAPTMVATLLERGSPPARTHLVYNWAEEDSIGPCPTGLAAEQPQGARILYGGNVGDMQDLDTVVTAAHRAAHAGVELAIVGSGIALPRIRALADSLGATNVTFHGRVPRAKMSSYYAWCDFAVVSLKDLPNFRGTVPSKLQASLSHGTPVIVTVQGDVRAIVDSLGVGFAADAEDVDSLKEAFVMAADLSAAELAAMRARARSAYVSEFSASAGIASLERVLLTASAL
ncbi:glycosyltransferase family 4 protein [Tessaracoccus lubricantis]|uniref:Glycosyltransferase family 4 protein n=1 Tax=Tessaracoccus lubricantis TaxID=545543 RepID=A0ABP9FT06_9ACTN